MASGGTSRFGSASGVTDDRPVTVPPSRDVGVDLLRLIGMLAIVGGHVALAMDRHDPIATDWLYPWHVPLFFVLAGYFAGRTPPQTDAYLRTKTRALLRPLLSAGLIIGVPYLGLLLIAGKWTFVADVAQQVLLGGPYLLTPFSAFWFVLTLFIAGLWLAWTRRLPIAAQGVVFGLVLATAAVAAPSLAATPWSVGLAVPALALMQIGVATRHLHRLHPAVAAWVAVVISALGAIALTVGFLEPLDMRAGNFGSPTLSLVAAGTWTAALTVAATNLPHVPARVSSVTAASMPFVLPIILLHGAVLIAVERSPLPGWATWLIALLAAVIGPVLLAQNTSQLPVVRWLTDDNRRVRQRSSINDVSS